MKSFARTSLTALAAAACLTAVGPAQAVDLNAPTGSAGIIAVDKIGANILFIDPVSFKTIETIKTESNYLIGRKNQAADLAGPQDRLCQHLRPRCVRKKSDAEQQGDGGRSGDPQGARRHRRLAL